MLGVVQAPRAYRCQLRAQTRRVMVEAGARDAQNRELKHQYYLLNSGSVSSKYVTGRGGNMKLAFAAAALVAASVAAPVQAVTAYIAPTLGGYLVSSTGYEKMCPTAYGTPLGFDCITTPGVFHAFTLWDGLPIDAGDLVGTVNYNTFFVGSHNDSFGYSGTLVFGPNGALVSNTMTITEDGDDRGSPINTSFYQQGLYFAVPIKLADGTVLVPPPPVPEPATWAMLIAGFGAVGMAFRRRPQALLAA